MNNKALKVTFAFLTLIQTTFAYSNAGLKTVFTAQEYDSEGWFFSQTKYGFRALMHAHALCSKIRNTNSDVVLEIHYSKKPYDENLSKSDFVKYLIEIENKDALNCTSSGIPKADIKLFNDEGFGIFDVDNEKFFARYTDIDSSPFKKTNPDEVKFFYAFLTNIYKPVTQADRSEQNKQATKAKRSAKKNGPIGKFDLSKLSKVDFQLTDFFGEKVIALGQGKKICRVLKSSKGDKYLHIKYLNDKKNPKGELVDYLLTISDDVSKRVNCNEAASYLPIPGNGYTITHRNPVHILAVDNSSDFFIESNPEIEFIGNENRKVFHEKFIAVVAGLYTQEVNAIKPVKTNTTQRAQSKKPTSRVERISSIFGGDRISATYSDILGTSTYEFRKNGTVFMNSPLMGMTAEHEYKIEGDKIMIISPQATLTMTLMEDGTIKGPMGLPLIPVDEKKKR